MYKREDLQKLSSLAVNKARSVSMAVKVALLCLVLEILPNLSAQLSNESEEHMLSDIMCQLFLGDIPRCPASSCKEVADTKLGNSRDGIHWLVKDFSSFQAYCVTNMSPSESRGGCRWPMSLPARAAPLDWSQSLLEGGRCAARQSTLAAALSPSLHRESATARCAVECMGIKRTVQMPSIGMLTAPAALLTSHTWME